MALPNPKPGGDLAERVDFVATDAVVCGRRLQGGLGLEEWVENCEWCLPVECSMGSSGVVVLAKRVELKLELGDGVCRRLLVQEALDGLVEALDLAAGLRVVGRGVFEDDAQALQLKLEQDLAAPGPAGEDGGVVAEQGSWQPERI